MEKYILREYIANKNAVNPYQCVYVLSEPVTPEDGGVVTCSPGDGSCDKSSTEVYKGGNGFVSGSTDAVGRRPVVTGA